MENSMQTSLEQEFNRLNFLASIATGTSTPDGNLSPQQSQQNKPVIPAVCNGQLAANTASGAGINGSQVEIPKSTVNNLANGMNPNSIKSLGNIGKINSLLINSSAQPASSFQVRNATSSQANITGPVSVRPRIYAPRGPRAVAQIRSQVASPRQTAPQLIARQQANVTPTKIINSQSNVITPKSTVNISVPSATPVKVGATLTEEQKRALLSGVNILQQQSTISVNSPLVISQPQNNQQQAKMLAQPSITTANGQTILLPANFAGMPGKFYIVNNSGKQGQAVTLTSNANSIQQQILTQNQTQSDKKPMLLLPNTSKTDKPNVQQIPNLQPTSGQTLTALQQHQQQVVNNALQMIVANNNSQQQLKIQPPNVQGQQMPRLAQTQQVPRLQQAQPISMTSFQNIRPKGQPSVRSIQPKTTVSPVQLKTAINTSQGIRLSHFPSQSVLPGKQQIAGSTQLKNTTTVPLSSTMSQLAATTSQPLMSQFDKTMSYHLQTLEQTDPQLFFHKGGKLIINQIPSSISDKVPSITTSKQIHDKVKVVLQQQTQNVLQNLKSSTANTFQLSANTKQQQNVKTQFNVMPQVAMTSQTPNQPVSVAAQVLTIPQKQHGNLQSIIKQQFQQQQQQALQNQSLGTRIKLGQQQHQLKIGQQQQQQLSQTNVLTQPQLYMMQQKILQQVQSQQKIAPQLLNMSLPTSTHVQQGNAQANNQPLKMLSSLTNMVNSMPGSKTITTTSVTSTSVNTPALMQPLLVQLPGGTHMLNTSQLTAEQVIELQKTIIATQNAQAKQIANFQSQLRPTGVNMTSANANQLNNSSSLSSAAKIAIQSISNRQGAQQNKSVFSLQGNKLISSQQQIIQRTSASPSIQNKSLSEHLKNLTPAQRELIVKQYAAGKLGTNNQGINNPAILASMLKNKQLQIAKLTPDLSPKLTRGSLASPKKGDTKVTNRALKRPVEVEKKEPDEHPFSKRWRGLIQTDQIKYVSPNYKLPFASRKEAISRLMSLHLGQEPESELRDYRKTDILLQAFAKNFLERKDTMSEKLNQLLLKESQIKLPSCDDVLMRRLFVASESERFQLQKKAVADGRAFVVKKEDSDDLECVEVSDNAISINISEPRQLDDRLLIARKDISTIDAQLNDEQEEDEEEEEMEEEEEAEDVREEEEAIIEPIEVEEISVGTMELSKEESELAAATNNLLADLQNDDYLLDFEL